MNNDGLRDTPCHQPDLNLELETLTLSIGFGGSKRTDEPAVLGSHLNPISRMT